MTVIYKLFGIQVFSKEIDRESLATYRIKVGHYKRCWWNPLTMETPGYDPLKAFEDSCAGLNSSSTETK